MAVLVLRTLSKEETVYLKSVSESQKVYVGTGVDLIGSDIPHEKINLTEEDNKNVIATCKNAIFNFPIKKVRKQQLGDALLLEDKITAWHYFKFRIYYLLINAEKKKITFHHFIQLTTMETKKLVFDNPSKYENSYPNVEFKHPKAEKRNYLTLLKYAFVFVYRTMFIGRTFSKRPNKTIYCYPDNEINGVGKDPSKSLKLDATYNYFLDKYKSELTVIEDISPPKFNSRNSWPIKKRYLYNKYKFTIPLERILIKFAIRKSNRLLVSNKINKIYADLNQASSSLSGYDELILSYLIRFKSSLKFYLYRYYALNSLFKKRAFSSFTCHSENTPSSIIAVHAAKRNQIKTIGIQHGSIYDGNMGYGFSKEEVALYNCHCDLTLTWSDYWSSILEKIGHYPKHKLKAVGQLRTDIIPELVKRENGKDDKQFNILFASQPQPYKEDRLRAAIDIIKLAEQNPSFNITVKLHPAEQEVYYSNLGSDSIPNLAVTKNSNLYHLISRSSVVITCYSTVGIESLYFRKPLIAIDYNNLDLADFIKEKLAFQAKDYNSLNKLVKQIEAKELTIDNSTYNDSIKKFAYLIDGLASDRVFQNI